MSKLDYKLENREALKFKLLKYINIYINDGLLSLEGETIDEENSFIKNSFDEFLGGANVQNLYELHETIKNYTPNTATKPTVEQLDEMINQMQMILHVCISLCDNDIENIKEALDKFDEKDKANRYHLVEFLFPSNYKKD